MRAQPLAIHGTGLMTAVGSDAVSCGAAFRVKVTNPTPTRFIDSAGDWIMAHQVGVAGQRPGLAKLACMAATVIDEALAGVVSSDRPGIPLLLCVAERQRPGRLEGLDDRLFEEIRMLLSERFSQHSAVVAQGRVGVAVALARARQLLQAGVADRILIAAVDSLLCWQTLMHYDRADRLLRQDNSNGFIPGEGAGAVLVGKPTGRTELLCTGLGFAHEAAHIDSERPLRADGLAAAFRAALREAGREIYDFDYRVADLSGEQYYFKEAALALSRTMMQPKDEFDLWHPAECTGEAGALAGTAIISLIDTACRKSFTRGPRIVAHMANDAGARAAVLMEQQGAR